MIYNSFIFNSVNSDTFNILKIACTCHCISNAQNMFNVIRICII